MGNWFYIIGVLLLIIITVLAGIAFSYALKIPFRKALIFALIVGLISILMPRVIDYFSRCKK